MIDKNKAGLTLGLFFAILHAVWALMIAVMKGTLQSFLDWIFKLHSLEPYWILTTFNLLNAILLVIMTFIIGYIFGWVFAWVHNLYCKSKKK